MNDFIRTIAAMNEEDKRAVVASLPSELMWDELRKRFDEKDGIIDGVKNLVRGCVNDAV